MNLNLNKEYLEKLLNSIFYLDKVSDQTKNKNFLLKKIIANLRKQLKCQSSAIFLYNKDYKKMDLIDCFKIKKPEFNIHRRSSLDIVTVSYQKCTKLKVDNSVIVPFGLALVEGFLVLANKKNGFDKQDIEFLKAYEDQLDSRIEHCNEHIQSLDRKRELEILYKIDHIRDSESDMKKMVSKVVCEVNKNLKSSKVFIALYDKNINLKQVEYCKNRYLHNSLDEKYLKKIINSSVKNSKFILQNSKNKYKYNVLANPLILGDVVVGVIGAIKKRDDIFIAKDIKLIKAVSSQIDTAIFEDITKTKIKNVFKRYVNEKIVEKMLQNSDDTNFLQGRKLYMTVLYADIRGFTKICEKIKKPEKLINVLNEYFKEMLDIIMDNDGTIDKFVGDEIMALFGAPYYYPEQ